MRRQALFILVLLAVLLAGFFVRAASWPLTAVPESRQALFRDETGEPYLTDMDSYYYLRLAAQMGEEDRPFLFSKEDPLLGARPAVPASSPGSPALLPLLAYLIWKVLSPLLGVSILQTARWIGPVFGSLAAIPAFFYVHRRTNLAGAAAAGGLAVLSIPFVAHTYACFFDTDCLLMLLPLGFILSHLRAMQETGLRRQLLFSALSSLCFALLSLTWVAYYAYFWLMAVGSLLACGALLGFRRVPKARKAAAFRGAGMTTGLSLLLLLLLRGASGIGDLGSLPAAARSAFVGDELFPYAFRHTEEMKALAAFPDPGRGGVLSLLQSGAGSVLNLCGGLVPCLAALAWLPLCLLEKRPGDKQRACAAGAEADQPDPVPWLSEACTLLPWLVIGVALTLRHRRAGEIIVMPLCVLAGLSAGLLCRLPVLRRGWMLRGFALLLCAAVCAAPFRGALQAARNNVPSVSDPKAEAMAFLRENVPGNTVIASWWDDGYFSEYAARLRTVADGGTDSGALYWFLAHALLTDDPDQPAGVFRMLAASGVKAVDVLTEKGFSTADAADLLIEISGFSRQDADEILSGQELLSPGDREALLDLTHPINTQPMVLAVSSDILYKLGAISYFGLWDMDTGRQETSLYLMASKASREWIPGTDCIFEMEGSSERLQVRIETNGGVSIIPDSRSIYYNASSVSLWEGGICTYTQELDGTGVSVMLLKDGDRVSALACNPELADSVPVRLFACGDIAYPGTELLGTWYGRIPEGETKTQSLLNYTDSSAWGIRLWRLESL